MKTTTQLLTAAAGALLAGLPLGAFTPAMAEVVTTHELPVTGLVLIQPCSGEQLSLSGAIVVTARTALRGTGADVGLRVDPLPGSAEAMVAGRFVSGAESFKAKPVLKVSVEKEGSVSMALANIALSCP